MTNIDPNTMTQPARTQAEAAVLFRRPFAPGAIGFRAMTKVPYKGEPYAGAQVAAYLGAQSVVQRLNAVVPGRWRQQFPSVPAGLVPAGTRFLHMPGYVAPGTMSRRWDGPTPETAACTRGCRCPGQTEWVVACCWM